MHYVPLRVAVLLGGLPVRGPPRVGDADGVVEGLLVVEPGGVGVEGRLPQLGNLALPLDEDHAVRRFDAHT